jgi:hypothetical protein
LEQLSNYYKKKVQGAIIGGAAAGVGAEQEPLLMEVKE